MQVKILFADDHEVVRRGLPALLGGSSVEVVGTPESGESLIAETSAKSPDVVVLDVRMGDEDGLEILARFKDTHPDTPVVMISTYDNPTYIARSLAYGATDYVLKGSSREDLIEAVLRAAKRQEPAETSCMRSVQTTMDTRKMKNGTNDTPLTNRELQVLRHIALGLSNKEIARSLGISVETVKEHVQNILRKLEQPDRTAAAVWAIKKGLLQ